MRLTRKTAIILSVVLLAGAFLVGYVWNNQSRGMPDLDGRWKLDASNEQACFTTVRFVSNPIGKNGGISLETTNGRFVQMYYGTYAIQTNGINIALTNPEVPPFDMKAESQENKLKLAYTWEGKEYNSCVYVKNK